MKLQFAFLLILGLHLHACSGENRNGTSQRKDSDQRRFLKSSFNNFWNRWEGLELPEFWSPNLIENWNGFDQDSPIAELLQTMIVYDDLGRPHSPKGVDPRLKAAARAAKYDRHHYPENAKRSIRINGTRTKRNFMTNANLWENNIIPYEIQPGFSPRMQNAIQSAIQAFSDMTCIRWIPRNQAPSLPHDQYVRFQLDSTGICAAFIGRTLIFSNGQPQPIKLADPTCATVAIVIHEMMHTIGQTHEQQRTDRDRYIEVYRDKIQSNSYFANFAQKSSYDRTPYDAESILQYSLTSAAVNQGERTMRLKDERLEALVGSSQTFTHSDVKEINLAYKCADHCQNPPNCRNGGFVGSQCDCVCPNGLTGATCEQVISDSGCGGVFNLQTGQQEIIESPNYPNAYSTDTVCLWLIRGPSDSNIRLTLQELDLARNTQQSKCLHWLEVRYNMPGQTGIRLCNTQQQQQQIITTNDGERNILILKFDSRLSRNVQPNQNQRFKLLVETVGGSTSNPCDPNPCLNSGVCSVFGTSFQCKCSQGWSGTVCNIASESCQSNPCLNGGACSMVGNSFSCTCQKGWTGPNCETPESQVTTVPFTTTTSQNSLSRLCDFEDSTCWMQSGNLMIGKIPQLTEGYSGTSSYAYSNNGEYFYLATPNGFLQDKVYCLTFGYYLSSGFLEVFIATTVNNKQNLFYTSSSTQYWSGRWQNIQGVAGYTLVLQGRTAYPGAAIAIDEVKLEEGTCSF